MLPSVSLLSFSPPPFNLVHIINTLKGTSSHVTCFVLIYQYQRFLFQLSSTCCRTILSDLSATPLGLMWLSGCTTKGMSPRRYSAAIFGAQLAFDFMETMGRIAPPSFRQWLRVSGMKLSQFGLLR